MPDSLSDAELVEAFLGGDSCAFTVLVRRYQTRLWWVARRYTANDDDALDIVQEVFFRASKNLCSFRWDCTLSTWLHRLVMNCGYDFIHHRERCEAAILDDERNTAFADRLLREDPVSSYETQLFIGDVLGCLSPEHRDAIIQVDIVGHSVNSLAAYQGVPGDHKIPAGAGKRASQGTSATRSTGVADHSNVWNRERYLGVGKIQRPHSDLESLWSSAVYSQAEGLPMTEASPDTPTIHDVAIVGSGPAGYTAAIYAARADLQPIVFEGIEFGGSLMTTTEVENYPGFAEGIMGPELMEQMRTQAERFGADLRMELVDRLEVDGEIKKIFVGDEEFQARTVILAMGSAPRYLGVPGEQELLGHGVSSCATCDGFFFRDQDIAVIGGGDSAMEEALFLTRFAKSVMVVHRREEFRASAIMLERARANEKITFVTNAVVDRVLSEDNKVSGLELKDTVTGETRQVDVAAMFVAIGADPRSELVKGQVDTDASGHVLVAHPSTKTNVPGVFAVGDLVDDHYQQAITAAGSGARAAIDAQHYLVS